MLRGNTNNNHQSSNPAGAGLDNSNANNQSAAKQADIKVASAQKYLTNCKSIYSCIHCRAHLANHDELVSRSFQGNYSRASLFNSVINVLCGRLVYRELTTGAHAVADLFCANCKTMIGWKYEKAFVESQKYKEGKYIIELVHVVRQNRHLELDKGEQILQRTRRATISHGISSGRHRQLEPVKSSACDSVSGVSPSGSQGIGSSQNSSNASGGRSSESSGSSPDEGFVQSHFGSAQSDAIAIGSMSVADSEIVNENNYEFSDDDDDDELIFPFCDDLCSNLLSSCQVNSLSSSSERRLRRNLCIDSTPYDWKHVAVPIVSLVATEEEPSLRLSDSKPVASTSSLASSSSRSVRSSATRASPPDTFAAAPNTEQTTSAYQINDDCSDSCDEPQARRRSSTDCQIAGNSSKPYQTNGIRRLSVDGSLSLDDEEFFDCASDHRVS